MSNLLRTIARNETSLTDGAQVHTAAEVGSILNSCSDFTTAFSRVAHVLTEQLADGCLIDCAENDWAFKRVAVALADPERKSVADDLATRFSTEFSPPLGAGNVLRTGRAEIYPELTDNTSLPGKRDAEHARIVQALGVHSLIVAPIESRGRIVGVITLFSTHSSRVLGGDALTRLLELSPCLGLAIDNELLRQAALRDRALAETVSLYRDEFLGMISHELRTPLQAILGWTQLLRENKLDQTATVRAMESLERNVKLQAQIINDLLDVSHIGTGRLRLEIKPIDLRPVIQGALDSLKLSIQAKRLELSFNCQPSSAAVVNGDPEWLQRVVWNLLSNAVKFTPDAGRIGVELTHDSHYAVLRVTDTGKGIASEFLPHIFERFRQKDSSTTRQYGGLGIGLTIVRHITESHGGTIQAESRGENLGAVFTVRLPVTAQRPSNRARDSQRRDTELFFSSTLAGLRVLVVEDEADTRDLIGMVLEQGGAKVTLSSDAGDAFKIIRRGKHDVLVSDIGMAGEDGLSFIRRVRTLSADQGGKMPALALTAYARAEDRIQALAAGFQMHIPKPVEPDELILAIGSLATRVV